jgi:hypothetical protein
MEFLSFESCVVHMPARSVKEDVGEWLGNLGGSRSC